MIFCKSRRAAERTLANIVPFIENKLFLKVNEDKTVVDYVGRVKFLGVSFYVKEGQARVRIHPKSVIRLKAKIRQLTARSNGWSNEKRKQKLREYVTGWINYFKVADIKSLLVGLDKWLQCIVTKYLVRRLTPTECERLQGYPDGWTLYGHDGKEISDTRRYQMLGNSVAVTCVAYILQGIAEQFGLLTQ